MFIVIKELLSSFLFSLLLHFSHCALLLFQASVVVGNDYGIFNISLYFIFLENFFEM